MQRAVEGIRKGEVLYAALVKVWHKHTYASQGFRNTLTFVPALVFMRVNVHHVCAIRNTCQLINAHGCRPIFSKPSHQNYKYFTNYNNGATKIKHQSKIGGKITGLSAASFAL